MKRRDNWKQDTPLMQRASTTQSLWGHANNARDLRQDDEMIDVDLFVHRMHAHAEEILELLPFLEKGSW